MNGYKPCPICGGAGYLKDKKDICLITFFQEKGIEDQPCRRKCVIDKKDQCLLFTEDLCDECECPECEGCGEVLE
ncbi:MAG: hypothetical protein WC517_03715 [Patescibacteria group bacterium]